MGNPTRLVHNDMVIEVVPTAPASPTVGMPCRIGDIPGVPVEIPQGGGKIPLRVRGVFKLPVLAESSGSGSAVEAGDDLYWGDADDVLDKTSSGKIRFGIALDDVAASQQKRINVYIRDQLVKGASSPTNFQEQATSNIYTTVRLSWRAPTDTGGNSITAYTLEYSVSGSGSWTQDTTISPPYATVISRTVSSLTPGTSYDFRVRATTSEGDGAWATLTHATTALRVPRQTTNLRATDQTGSSITIGWNAPSDTGGSSITSWSVWYREFGAATWNIDDISNPSDRTYVISGLSPGTAYDIRVRAVNAQGLGILSSTITPSTYNVPGRPGAPSRIGVSRTAMSVVWTAPSNDGGTPIIGYTVQHRENGQTGWTNISIESSTINPISITSLTAGTTYDVRVFASNLAGNSPPSEITEMTTNSLSAPGAPGTPTRSSRTRNSITIAWTAPSDNGGSAITGYVVQHREDGTSTWTDTTVSGGTTRTATISSLDVDTDYEFRVYAVNSVGNGTASGVLDDSTEAASVPGAPTGVQTDVQTSTTLSIVWVAPSDDGGASILEYRYRYKLDSAASYSSTTVTETGSTALTVTITGLSSGTDYNVQISARNSAGWGAWSTAGDATTQA